MLTIGIPLLFIEWVKAWFTNRVARVKVTRSTGRSRTFIEALPQSSVISPLFFNIFINDLLGSSDSNTLVSAYADDLALVKRGRNKGQVGMNMQAEVDKVVRWSTDNWLTLNASKSKVALFTMNCAESSCCPHITIGGLRLTINVTLTFLGVRYDRKLNFNEHIQCTSHLVKQRTNLLRQLAKSTWE